ncbi:MAG: hypothetical protein HY456_02555 [Parcubacteria group bacterium]|nr:hypothetical protein [Parcubacteria group bacterium]
MHEKVAEEIMTSGSKDGGAIETAIDTVILFLRWMERIDWGALIMFLSLLAAGAIWIYLITWKIGAILPK